MSRPFRVRFAIWSVLISCEFSLEDVCTGVASATTETSSVTAPSARAILPKSRTELARDRDVGLRVAS